MEERQASRQHKIILTNRGTCALNGISDILSFDVNEILLETEMGMLMIRGMDLHVNRLTLEKGEVDQFIFNCFHPVKYMDFKCFCMIPM